MAHYFGLLGFQSRSSGPAIWAISWNLYKPIRTPFYAILTAGAHTSDPFTGDEGPYEGPAQELLGPHQSPEYCQDSRTKPLKGPKGCFQELEVICVGVCITRALLFGVYVRAPIFWKLQYMSPIKEPQRFFSSSA